LAGQFLQESTLTPANVNAAHFGLLRELPVDGKVDAQPLVLTGFTIGGVARDVVYTATEHDSVYAFDANSGAQLWKVSLLGVGETPSDVRSCTQVVPEIGVTATPVIDRAAGKIFLVAMSKNSAGTYAQRLHALDLTTGAEISGSPVTITASMAATGPAPQAGTVTFDPGQYKERSALLLSGEMIYTSWASHCDYARFDAVSPNTPLGVVEDGSRLMLKVNVEEADFGRTKIGQPVEARTADGRVLEGAVAWKTPAAGQTVRDQDWNVLIRVDGDNTGVELGDKVIASIEVGKRSLFRRWFKPAGEMGAGPRVAAVRDPTELSSSPGAVPESVAAVHDQQSDNSPTLHADLKGR
jgi:outer membrane protein assembly factor BamB